MMRFLGKIGVGLGKAGKYAFENREKLFSSPDTEDVIMEKDSIIKYNDIPWISGIRISFKLALGVGWIGVIIGAFLLLQVKDLGLYTLPASVISILILNVVIAPLIDLYHERKRFHSYFSRTDRLIKLNHFDQAFCSLDQYPRNFSYFGKKASHFEEVRLELRSKLNKIFLAESAYMKFEVEESNNNRYNYEEVREKINKTHKSTLYSIAVFQKRLTEDIDGLTADDLEKKLEIFKTRKNNLEYIQQSLIPKKSKNEKPKTKAPEKVESKENYEHWASMAVSIWSQDHKGKCNKVPKQFIDYVYLVSYGITQFDYDMYEDATEQNLKEYLVSILKNEAKSPSQIKKNFFSDDHLQAVQDCLDFRQGTLPYSDIVRQAGLSQEDVLWNSIMIFVTSAQSGKIENWRKWRLKHEGRQKEWHKEFLAKKYEFQAEFKKISDRFGEGQEISYQRFCEIWNPNFRTFSRIDKPNVKSI